MSRAGVTMKVTKCPAEDLALTNLVYVSPPDFQSLSVKNPRLNTVTSYVTIKGFVFTIKDHPAIPPSAIGFTSVQRRFAEIALNDNLLVTPFVVDAVESNYLGSIALEVDYLARSSKADTFDCTALQDLVVKTLENQFLTLGQQFVLDVYGRTLIFLVKSLDVFRLSDVKGGGKKEDKTPASRGILAKKTEINFSSAPKSGVKLTGNKSASATLFKPDFNFENMGIGGLDDEFGAIFRRAFASRVFPPHIVAQLGIKHIKGILLYGPPGTGKTLMARQIGKMLNGKEPKIVNGPEILNKYVGQSEENIRNLFKDAEAEYKAKGDDSDLHIIIFDEIDAICKARGTTGGSTGVADTVVNQLLSKIDGVDSLNNILVIGMTNRKDMIDEALLRPGRLEVQMEIGLPDQDGRLQILKIHTNKMNTNGYLAPDVDLVDLAAKTKNFTGAELEGLVKSAASFAFNRHIDANNLLKPESPDKIKIAMQDFMGAFSEVQPAFGITGTEFKEYIRNGIIPYGPAFNKTLETGRNFVAQVKHSDRTPLVSILFEGAVGSGKTALAATLAVESDFPFAKIISPEELVNYSEAGKCTKIAKVFQDAYKSPLSVIVLDDIERLLDYVPIGPRFSNAVLQTLLVLIKKVPTDKRKLLVIGTTSNARILEEMEFMDAFNAVIRVPSVASGDEVKNVLKELNVFTPTELEIASNSIFGEIPIKKLLMITEMARQGEEGTRAERFIQCMEDYGVKK
eukprot:TRINITY_DN4836_c0_g1_i1.p1 TRINITY_DN4836_c0_g1~~TRINITY_DN4836_c0_g1_i1.p1  ORF type:complete len:740 (-),score=208.35 TRINITY_DN4836_c0_g1_i1:138-2357(-)